MKYLQDDHELNDRISSLSKENEVEWVKSQVYSDIYENFIAENKTSENLYVIYKKVRDIYIKDIIEQGYIGWNHETYKKFRSKQRESDEYILNPHDVAEGVITCPRCNSDRIYSCSMQLRSGDEPMTTLAECTNCKLKWSHN